MLGQPTVPLDEQVPRVTDLILVNDPALRVLIPTFIAVPLFGNPVDGEVLEICTAGQGFAKACFADTRCACDDDVRHTARHGCSGDILAAHSYVLGVYVVGKNRVWRQDGCRTCGVGKVAP